MKKTVVVALACITSSWWDAMSSRQQLASLEVSLNALHKIVKPSAFTPEQIADAKQELAKDPDAFNEAAKKGDVKKVKLFIAAGADVNKKDKTGYALLHRATLKGNDAMVKLLSMQRLM